VIVPFPSSGTDDDSEPSPLDEIFALIDFDIATAKTAVLEIDLLDKILDLIIVNLGRLDSASLISFCTEVIDLKGKESAKQSAMFIVLLMEISSGEATFSQCSSNMSCVKGVRVERKDGACRVWTITKASFQQGAISILAAILARIDNELAKRIVPLLSKDSVKGILSSLEKIKVSTITSESSYFVLKKRDTPSSIAESASSSYSHFEYRCFSSDNVPVGESRQVSWLCSGDQKEYIGLFMDTLGVEGLRGDVLETCTLEYLLKMCTVLHTSVDPFKFNARIEKINGARADEGEEEEEDEGGDGETQEDGSEPITPFELCRLLRQEVEGEDEPIRYDFWKKPLNPKKSTRVRNGLAIVAQVCTIFTANCNWLKPHGSQYNAEYSKFLATKLGAEVKSFLSNGNSLYWYLYPFNIIVLQPRDLI
jgi:hypothetical protein